MRMPDAGFPVEVIRGVPVVATPEDVDINNAAGLRGLIPGSAGSRGTPRRAGPVWVTRSGSAGSPGPWSSGLP